jgi:hypothetical protein
MTPAVRAAWLRDRLEALAEVDAIDADAAVIFAALGVDPQACAVSRALLTRIARQRARFTCDLVALFVHTNGTLTH